MKKYKKCLGASLFKHEAGFVIIKGREVFKINEVGARIFELCNSSHDEEGIIAKLSNFYNTTDTSIESEIKDFIHELEKLNVIRKVG
ncbi:hypothetical protein COD94_06445 [Bacillus cereus]|nr:hypothetical protein COD94_06445 [Bacillus cereus]